MNPPLGNTYIYTYRNCSVTFPESSTWFRQYLICLYPGQFVNGLAVLGFEKVVGGCEYVECQTSGSPPWLPSRRICEALK